MSLYSPISPFNETQDQCFWGGADRLRSEHHNGREEAHVDDGLTQREESMTTIMAFRLASVVTAIDVLVACGFSIAAIIRADHAVNQARIGIEKRPYRQERF